MPRAARLKLVDPAQVEPAGDPEMTRARIAEWSAGQRKCRRRRRHDWHRIDSVVYGRRAFDAATLNDLPAGTRINVIEQCKDCRNKQQADHLVYVVGRRKVRHADGTTSTETDKGLRIVDRWQPLYGEVKGVPYLLDRGSQPVTIEMREQMYAQEFFEHPGRVSYVVEGDE